MKKLILYTVLILIFAACSRSYTEHPTLLRAEKLMLDHPDSAYLLLNSIHRPENLSEPDKAAWCLHYTHAQYKLYKEIPSDSIIRIAYEYYKNSGLNQQAGLSHYLLACIYELNDDSKSAMYHFKNADDLFEKTTDYYSRGLSNYRISNLLLNDEYYSDAETFIQKAIKLLQKAHNARFLAYSYRTKAEIYYRKNANIKLILNQNALCQQLALQIKDSNLYFNSKVFEAKVLLGSYPLQSKLILQKVFKQSPYKTQELISLLANAYSKLDQPDSARQFIKYIQPQKNDLKLLHLQELTLSYILKSEKNADEAFSKLKQAYIIRDSIYVQSTKEQLIRIDKQYDLSKKEAEKAKLEIRNQKNLILIAFLSIIVLSVLIIMLALANVNKKKEAAMQIEKQQLKFEIQSKQVENDKKLRILLANLQNKIDNTLRFKTLQSDIAKVDKKELFIAEITRQVILTDKEWQYYIDEANELFNGNLLKLKNNYPQLTNADMIMIALICLKIDIHNSMLLLDYSSYNTMYSRRNRIKKHLGLDVSVDLEKWLYTNIIEQI